MFCLTRACSFALPLLARVHPLCHAKTKTELKLKPTLEEACSQEYPESAFCVRRFDDSLNSAIRTTYRISLRSSSLPEPRYPLLRVVRIRLKAVYKETTFREKKKGFTLVSETPPKSCAPNPPQLPAFPLRNGKKQVLEVNNDLFSEKNK